MATVAQHLNSAYKRVMHEIKHDLNELKAEIESRLTPPVEVNPHVEPENLFPERQRRRLQDVFDMEQ